jgi:hypothetical protein
MKLAISLDTDKLTKVVQKELDTAVKWAMEDAAYTIREQIADGVAKEVGTIATREVRAKVKAALKQGK